jgi:hypothetical protein
LTLSGKLLAGLALIACLAVIAIVLTRSDRPDPTGGVEQRLGNS